MWRNNWTIFVLIQRSYAYRSLYWRLCQFSALSESFTQISRNCWTVSYFELSSHAKDYCLLFLNSDKLSKLVFVPISDWKPHLKCRKTKIEKTFVILYTYFKPFNHGRIHTHTKFEARYERPERYVHRFRDQPTNENQRRPWNSFSQNSRSFGFNQYVSVRHFQSSNAFQNLKKLSEKIFYEF